MNKEENNDIKYSAADIHRYLQGTMPAMEMHALEKAALEDPFLADALEGYSERQGPGKEDIQDDLDELKARLKTRTEPVVKKMSSPVRWWRIAALLLLLAGTGTIVYKIVNTSNLQEKSIITKNENMVQDTVSVSVAKDQIKTIDTSSVALNEVADQKSLQAGKKERNIGLYKSKAPSRIDLPRSETPNLALVPAPERPSASLKYDSEKVSPVVATTSKTEELMMADNSRALKKAAPNSRIDSKKTITAESIPVNEKEAEPVIGFEAYEKYVEKNRKTDSLLNLRGEVIVSFLVDADGKLRDLKIEKSLSEPMDREAIRLIKEGPAWKVFSNKKNKVEYSIRF